MILSKLMNRLRPLVSTPIFGFSSKETIFGKIARKEMKANIVYEDDKCLAFKDISPQAPIHIILIPKITEIEHLSQVKEQHKDILGHLLYTAAQIAKEQKIAETGWRMVINDGKHGQQTVDHLHLHIIGGKQLTWPPG